MAVLQLVMESGAEGLIGTWRGERSGMWSDGRSGYRGRTLDTRLEPSKPVFPG